jgi:hypothetical protein
MISKFVEDLGYGRVSNRVAYALDCASLPLPSSAAYWRKDHKFDEAKALAREFGLSRVFDTVRLDGFVIVTSRRN